LLKNTYWSTWLLDINIPQFLDGDIIDKYFAQEVKEISKAPVRKDSIANNIEKAKQISLLDDKKSRNVFILLSRFPVSSTDIVRILENFEVDSLQFSKNIIFN
jgi:hypothetical protein